MKRFAQSWPPPPLPRAGLDEGSSSLAGAQVEQQQRAFSHTHSERLWQRVLDMLNEEVQGRRSIKHTSATSVAAELTSPRGGGAGEGQEQQSALVTNR